MGSDAKETYAALSNSLCDGGRMSYEDAHKLILARDDCMQRLAFEAACKVVEYALDERNDACADAQFAIRRAAASMGTQLDAPQGEEKGR